ncbi:collagenase-like [Anopheles marshallii]|uniref:collagenase-like n=1 Tax=Anopheles marshallii TaxID=1521116 RepID=UPI00237ADA03|nr:collagenase-like [Anopheles marshallii]
MLFFSTVLVVFGIVSVSPIKNIVQQLPMKLIENLGQDVQPIVEASNNLSTDGYLAYPGQFPYHARLFVNRDGVAGIILIDGSLITPNYILTRANTRNRSTYGYAILGIDDGSRPETQQQINFTQGGMQIHPIHDIATVRLDHPVTFTKFVQPIRLPRLFDSRTYEMMEGTNVGELVGLLRYVRNQVISNEVCNEQHPLAYISSYHICTNAYVGGAFCSRSHGSGLIIEDETIPILVGVTTLMYKCSVNYPVAYLRVSEFRDWISMNSDYVFDA